MKLFTAFSVLFLGLLHVQLGDSCGPMSLPMPRRPQPTCNHTKNNGNESAGLEIPPPQEVDSVLWSIVKDGASRGLTECQKVFGSNRWNCPVEMYKKLPIFDNTTFPYATRETAVIHAISAAAITDEVTHQCRHNMTPGCNCSRKPKQYSYNYGREVISWGCSDNIEFGEEVARRFTDRLETGSRALMLVNLHNNEVGREVLRNSSQLDCICYGLNRSCQFKHCWKELAPFDVVASKLKEKYLRATQVWFVDNKLQERVGDQFQPINKYKGNTLVYLHPSPHPCERNDTLGYRGMLGRSCRSDVAKDKCVMFVRLCEQGCNLRVDKVERYKHIKCNCKFHFCCEVKCERCAVKYFEVTCNALKPVVPGIQARAHP